MRFFLVCAAFLAGTVAYADGLACDLSNYKSVSGLTAAAADNLLSVTWDADDGQDLRMRLALEGGAPVIRDLTVRRKGAAWKTLLVNATPEFRIVSGKRRISNQQLQPLRGLGEVTPELISKEKWEAFWDAPLDIPGIGPEGRVGFGGNLPLDLPRSPSEIHRAGVSYHITGCEVRTNGGRLEITLPGVDLGVFSGALQFTVYKGSGLIRQEIIAKTVEQSVAYKYDAGLKGVPIETGSSLRWRDVSRADQTYEFRGSPNQNDAILKTTSRTLIAERGKAGSIAVFPPPHTFFWAREVEINLGYNWYRKTGDNAFSFGVRQAEKEDSSEGQGNFALYSAPPGSLQHMAVYFYADADDAPRTFDKVLAFTHGDRFKPLPGYQVMAHHYHMDLGERLIAANDLDARIPDLEAIKSIGINIVSQLSSITGSAATADNPGRGGGRGARPDPLKIISASVEGAKRHSDKNFLVLPNQEYFTSPLGGHTDLLFSHPVYWDFRRAGQPLVEDNPVYGKTYHLGSSADLMEMAKREDVLINMPHPRTKGSTGYPDAVKDKDYFNDPHYQGVGFRWGMGLDLSDKRLCDHRCFALLDDMSNWTSDRPEPPKYMLAITETRYKAPGDEVYAASPVNYVKLDAVPSSTDYSSINKALFRGDFFITSGEVLIDSFSLQGTGAQRTAVADVEWTFPLEFVELVWGDGKTTDRQIIPATQLPAFGRHRFQIPFNTEGKKWIRLAAWDSAGNGASGQPIKMTAH